MFEDDDYLGLSEAEAWYDNNLRYFDRKNKPPGLPVDVELFYHSVYVPFQRELKEPLRAMVQRNYPLIATETRPEILADIERRIDWVGHQFILFLRDMIQFWKTGKDLREIFPDLDERAVSNTKNRKPNYLDPSLLDRFSWATAEQKQEFLDEDRKEVDERFAHTEKLRFEFFDLLQSLTFKCYREVQNLDSDGWVMFEAFLIDEYFNYQMSFEDIEGFIEYEFDVEDLKLPYNEYFIQYTERWKKRREEELRKIEEEEKKKSTE